MVPQIIFETTGKIIPVGSVKPRFKVNRNFYVI